MDFFEPLKYPRDMKKLITGGLLLFPFGFLIFPALIVSGYCIRVMEETIKGNDEMPEFENWTYLFKKGMGSLAISFAWYLIPFFLLMCGYVFMFLPSLGFEFFEDYFFAWIFLFLLGMLVIIVSQVLMYVAAVPVYVAFARYAKSGNFTSGFDVKEIFKNIRLCPGDYVITFLLLYIGVSFLIYLPIIVLFITIIGIFFIGVVFFWWCAALSRGFAQVYRKSKKVI